MTLPKSNYKAWFFTNPHNRDTAYKPLEQEAAAMFLTFINGKDYGKGVSAFRFDTHIAPSANFGRDVNTIALHCAHLTTFIDKTRFDTATHDDQLKLLLTASLAAVEFLAAKVKLPKGFQGQQLADEYKTFLTERALLLKTDQTEDVITKTFETTRFHFRLTMTAEVQNDHIHYDLNDIQDFINNGIAGKTFGTSINKIDFGFELYDFLGQFAASAKQTMDLKRYSPQGKNFLVVKHFDYSQMKHMSGREQYEVIRSRVLEGMNDYFTLSKKPADFDMKLFYETLQKLLTDYSTKFL